MCPLTHLKPDILLFPSITTCILQNELQTWGPAERSLYSLILLGVSFTSDTVVRLARLRQGAMDKCKQRSLLRQALHHFGWKTVTVLPLIIKQNGTIPATFSTALPQCRVEDARLTHFLTDLHYAAIEYTSDVLYTHHRATKRLCTTAPSPTQPVPIATPNFEQHAPVLLSARHDTRPPFKSPSAPHNRSNVPHQFVSDPGGSAEVTPRQVI